MPAKLGNRKIWQFSTGIMLTCKPFRITTCKSVSKQMTSSPFRINTYEKTGGEGAAGESPQVKPPQAFNFPFSIFPFHFVTEIRYTTPAPSSDTSSEPSGATV